MLKQSGRVFKIDGKHESLDGQFQYKMENKKKNELEILEMKKKKQL